MIEDGCVEVIEKYNDKGVLVERCYSLDGKTHSLPIPTYLQKQPVLLFFDPDISYVICKRIITTPQFNQLKGEK